MAANGRIVNTTVNVTYDGVTTRLQRGTVIDVPSGSALETAIGAANLTALTAQQEQPGSSDSLGPAMLDNTAGGGNEPFAYAAQ